MNVTLGALRFARLAVTLIADSGMDSLMPTSPAPMLEKVDCAFDFFAQVLQGTDDTEMLSSILVQLSEPTFTDRLLAAGLLGVLGVLLNALQSDAETSLQQAAMEQLELLMQQLQTLEAGGLVAKLQVLSQSSDSAVLSKARFLLQNFFPAQGLNTEEGSRSHT
eukprot:Skav227195  [mRNA]  locus=scaffold2048:195621:202969:- [translate_table: standard]